MSILIKGLDMPAKGEYRLLLFCHSDGTANLEGISTDFKDEPFEVIEVPAPHGRLMDGDILESLIHERISDLDYKADAFDILMIVQDMRTIVEAEKE